MQNVDFTSAVGDVSLEEYYQLKNNFMFWGLSYHTWRTVIGLGLVFIVGGLQALKGVDGWGDLVTTVVPILLILEHSFSGNTTTS